MFEATKWLRDLCGDKLILGCGLPLFSVTGLFDFCRIGPDIGMSWQNKWMKWANIHEPISSRNAAFNCLFRQGINGSLFMSDADVVLLRIEKTKLKPIEKDHPFYVNLLTSNLHFTSDWVTTYEDDQLSLIKENDYPYLYLNSFL